MGVAPSFWRGLLILWAAAMIVLVAFVIAAPRGVIIAEAVLRSERGPVGNRAVVASGERLRLDVELRRPAALVLLLCDPAGKLSEIFPPPGDAEVLPGPAVRLPPRDEAWEPGALEGGTHSLWIIASPEPISQAKRARLRGLIQDALKRWSSGHDAAGRDRVIEDLGRGLKAESVECTEKWFRIDAPRHADPGEER